VGAAGGAGLAWGTAAEQVWGTSVLQRPTRLGGLRCGSGREPDASPALPPSPGQPEGSRERLLRESGHSAPGSRSESGEEGSHSLLQPTFGSSPKPRAGLQQMPLSVQTSVVFSSLIS